MTNRSAPKHELSAQLRPVEDSQLLTPTQVAEMLQVPVATVRKWRHFGTGPTSRKIGKHIRFKREDVLAWIERQDAA